MKRFLAISGTALLGVLSLGTLCATRATAQVPILTPIIVDTAAPIVVNAIKPKPKNTGLVKFEGYVMHANVAQVTAKAKGNDMSIQTFPLSETASTKMQQVLDNGGYQYGDKITIYYDPQSLRAIKFKGKPSRPL
jgi:sugar phosphate permease